MIDMKNRQKNKSTDKIIKIPRNNKGGGSPNSVPGNSKNYDITDLSSGHANLRSSESDLLSGIMKGVIIYIP